MSDHNEIEKARVRAHARQVLFDEELVPTRIGRFELRDRIGGGSSGAVYRAYDPMLERDVALKLVHASTSRSAILAEGRALAQLSHPNVIAVLDVVEHCDTVVLAMELAGGVTLREHLRASRSREDILRLFMDAGRGLAAAHDAGLVHRDFKPDNVLVDESGHVRVVDFGLAIHAASAGDVREPRGTPRYMAPEQWRGDVVSAATDQFAFCAALVEALGGEPLFRGDTVDAIRAVAEADEFPVLDRRIPRFVRAVLRRGLAIDPSERFPKMATLLERLDPDRHRRRRRASLTVGAVLCGLVVVAFADTAAPCDGGQTRIDAVWNDVQRDQLSAHFNASDYEFGERTWPRVRQALDRWAADWGAAHREACEATKVRHERSEAQLDQRMLCLDRPFEAFRETVAVLGDADAVVRADRLVDSLPPPRRCDAQDAHTHPRYAEVGRAVSRAHVHISAGHYDEARELLGEVAVDPGGALSAQVLRAHGRLKHELGEYADAEDTFFEAIGSAQRARDGLETARSATGLARTLSHGLSRYTEALRWIELARATQEPLESTPQEQLDRMLVHGETLSAATRHAEAIEMLEDALALARTHHGETHLRMSDALMALGHAHSRATRGGCTFFERAWAIRVEAWGERHPGVAEVQLRLARCARIEARADEAIRLHESAIETLVEVVGEHHRDVARARFNLAWTLLTRGEIDRADTLYRQSREAYAHAGQRHLAAAALEGMGEVLAMRGRPAEALETYERVHEEYRPVLESEHDSYDINRWRRGNAMLALDRPAEAKVLYQEALAHRYRVHGDEGVADIALGLGLALARLGEREASIVALEQALRGAREADEVPVGPALLHLAFATDRRRAALLEEVQSASFGSPERARAARTAGVRAPGSRIWTGPPVRPLAPPW